MTADMKIAVSVRAAFNESVTSQGTTSTRTEEVRVTDAELPTLISDNGAYVEIRHDGDRLLCSSMSWRGAVKGIFTNIMPMMWIITKVRIVE